MNALAQDLWWVSPQLALVVGALLVLLLQRGPLHDGPATVRCAGAVTFSSLLAAIFLLLASTHVLLTPAQLWDGFVIADGMSWIFSLLILICALVVGLMGASRLSVQGIDTRAEFYALFLLCICGALIFVCAAELVTMFIALEMMSLALYCLCGGALATQAGAVKNSAESALKYFVLGSISAAFFLYGAAILFGLTGSSNLAVIAERTMGIDPSALYLGIGMILIALFFKLGAVPFHFWTPDVYQGAPTSVTALMSCVVKIAAVAVTIRLLWWTVGDGALFWSGAVWTVALLTMVIGSVISIHQTSLKRILAYSGIVHVGYMLCALLVPGAAGGAALIFYLIAYSAMTLGAFAVVLVVAAGGNNDHISNFAGLGRREPVLAAAMALFLLALAGLPPGLSGLFAKIYVFSAALRADYIGLVIIGVLSSVVAAYLYLRIIKVMYFDTASNTTEPIGELELSLGGVIALCSLGTLVLGFFPETIYAGVLAIAGG